MHLKVATLARRHGLADIRSMLNLDHNDVVRLMSTVPIAARLDCESRIRQLARGSPVFRGKAMVRYSDS